MRFAVHQLLLAEVTRQLKQMTPELQRLFACYGASVVPGMRTLTGVGVGAAALPVAHSSYLRHHFRLCPIGFAKSLISE